MPIADALVHLALEELRELVAPTRCAACDERIARQTLFCPPCAATVVRMPRRFHHRAVFSYGGAVADAIRRMKYEARADLASRFGQILREAAQELEGSVDIVVSVPMHARRLAERGFDQAALLAKPVARSLGVPWAPRALIKVRDTPRQATIGREARAENVTAAFAVRRRSVVAERRVLLVDDVRTTGATLAACTHALRAAEAGAVTTLVVAHRDWT